LSLPVQAADVAGFVLAGGQSSRMGVDKALVEFAGRPLIALALGTLREAGLEAAIAGARSDLSSYASVVADAAADLGPLSGICAALASTTAQWVVFMTVDLPLVPASLVVYLLAHARITESLVTAAAVNGFPQTFPAVIHRDCVPVLEKELKDGRRGCYSAYQAAACDGGQSVAILPVEVLIQAGHVFHPYGLPATRWFSNLNSKLDLARAAAYPHLSHRVS
jgi:molybdopterin-guanine dinucleotide biosynthesis protein A